MTKIILPIAELKPALIGLGKIVSRRTTLPVLSHIKIERTSDGWIALTSTDLDCFITVRLEQPAAGQPTSLLVPYDELLKITKNCQKTDALLIRSENIASEWSTIIEYAIGNQTAEAKVASIAAEEFPETPRVKGESIAVSDTLRLSIHQALGCASTDETRLILNGCFIDVTHPKCHHVVGTDGRHLFTSNSFSLPLKQSVMIPEHKFLGWKEFNSDGEWQLKVNAKEAKEDQRSPFQISSRRWRFIGYQIDGTYPNWKQVVPDSTAFSTSLELDPAIIEIIERMPCDDQINFAIGLEWAQNRLCLASRSPNADEPTSVEIQNVKGTGKDITIFLNRHFVIKALEFGLTKAEFIDSLSPMRFVDGGRVMVVMPTRPFVPSATPAEAIEQAPPVEEEPIHETPAAAKATPEEERKTMVNDTTTTTAEPATIDELLNSIITDAEAIRSAAQDHLSEVKTLCSKLKTVQRDHKTSTKELQSVRQTLKGLQGLKL